MRPVPCPLWNLWPQNQLRGNTGITTPNDVVTVGAWPEIGGESGLHPKRGHCSYTSSLRWISYCLELVLCPHDVWQQGPWVQRPKEHNKKYYNDEASLCYQNVNDSGRKLCECVPKKCSVHSLTESLCIVPPLTLFYNIVHSLTLCYTILHYFTWWYTIVHYDTLLYTIIHYYTLLYTIVHCDFSHCRRETSVWMMWKLMDFIAESRKEKLTRKLLIPC